MAMRDDYNKFLPLKDALSSIDQKVNLIGVVLDLGFPRTSSGTDYFCGLRIIDQSYPKYGIAVNVFMARMEDFPTFRSPGDIIQLYRVTMKMYDNVVYALFNKSFSAFALYEGKNGKDFVPYQHSSKFRPKDHLSKYIASLRTWLADFQVDEDGNTFSSLREIRKGVHANLVCKVLHVSEIAKNKSMALVWDGTDSPPNSIKTNPENQMGDELPLQLEPSPFPRELLCTFPTIGTILRVTIDNADHNHVLSVLNTGKWVKFISIFCDEHGGLWYALWTATTKLRYLSNKDDRLLECQRSYHQRLSRKFGCIPYSCFPWCSGITVDSERDPLVTLMAVLTSTEVTAKFRCMVRVVEAFPWSPEEFSNCGTYKVRLTIEDPTARIHAYVCAEDGEKFFGGHPSVEVLARKRDKLLGVAEESEEEDVVIVDAPRDPPWVQCCLKSYYTDENDIWGSRRYRIHNTRIVLKNSV